MKDKTATASPPRIADERTEYLLYAQVAEAVAEAIEAGSEPDVEALIANHPGHAEQIRQLVPTLVTLHQVQGQAGSAEPTPEITGPRQRLGDYRIIREIGRGGMGVVYEARQLSLSRRVALKVLPFAAVLDRRQLERFKNEAQAAAQLHHTNIVPVFGVGCERGVHYYAMQYIEGQTLGQVIEELRRLSGQPTGDGLPGTPSQITTALASGRLLDVRESAPISDSEVVPLRGPEPVTQGSSAAVEVLASTGSTRSPAFFRSVAQLGVQAAEALEHAHQEGVYHRDVKPGNLILDARGHLWVTDFGLARVESDPGLTVTGDILGTVRYMSPEQALAKRVPIDHRTDIYSLGVTLYELLTLRPAFTGRDRQELLRQIAFEEPRSPRKINPNVPRELETIVLKAMRKNPAERFESAKEFADDLERFLAYKPIKAKPPTLVERTGKWCRRHPAVVGSAMVLLVMAVVALSISTVLVSQEQVRTEAALAQARNNFTEAKAQRERAEANFQLAREAVNQMLTRVAEELEDQPHMEQIRQDLLQDALAFYERFLAQEGHDPDVRSETGRAYRRMGEINALLGQRSQADASYTQAIDVFEKLVAGFPSEPEYAIELAKTYATLCLTGGAPKEERVPGYLKAIGLLERLVADHPDVPEYQAALADAQLRLGDVHAREQGVSTFEVLSEAFPEAGDYQRGLASGLLDVADEKLKARQWDRARAANERALAIYETLVEAHADVRIYRHGLMWSYHNRAWYLYMNDQNEDAEQTYLHAIDLGAALVTDFPAIPKYRQLLAHFQRDLGEVLKSMDRFEEAAAQYAKGVSGFAELSAEFPDQTGYRQELNWTRDLWAGLYRDAGRLEEAEDMLRQALEDRQQLVAEFPYRSVHRHELAEAQRNLAKFLLDLGERDEAGAVYQQSIAAHEALLAEFPDDIQYINHLVKDYVLLSDLRRTTDQTEQADRLLAKARLLWEKLPELASRPESPDNLPRVHVDLVRLLIDIGRHEEAFMVLYQWVDVLEALLADGRSPAEAARRWCIDGRNLGRDLEYAGHLKEAEMTYLAIRRMYEGLITASLDVPSYEEGLRVTYLLLANLLRRTGRDAEAQASDQKALLLHSRLLAKLVSLARESADGVAQAVELARASDIEEGRMEPFSLLVWGEVLTLGGDPDRGAQAIQRAIDAGGSEHWYFKSLGWALAGAGRKDEAEAAFTQALTLFKSWSPAPPAGAGPDHWTAAYFLDLVTSDQYTSRWQETKLNGRGYAPFPWFYVGQRAETEGRFDDAIAAYENAVELGQLPNAHHTANYAAYRLQILTDRPRAAPEDPSTALLDDEP